VTHGPPPSYEAFRQTMPMPRTLLHGDIIGNNSNNSASAIIRKEDTYNDKTDTDIITQWNVKGKFMYIVLDSNESASEHNDNNNSQTQPEKVGDVDNDDDYLRSIWITLGMSGRFLSEKHYNRLIGEAGSTAPKLAKGKAIRWQLELGSSSSSSQNSNQTNTTTSAIAVQKTTNIYYQDTRNFGTLRFSLSRNELEQKLATLGPDLLTDELTQGRFLDILQQQRPTMNICKFLMDQRVSVKC
jgi:formamidopyrimidine-DNA glycosylase